MLTLLQTINSLNNAILLSKTQIKITMCSINVLARK